MKLTEVQREIPSQKSVQKVYVPVILVDGPKGFCNCYLMISSSTFLKCRGVARNEAFLESLRGILLRLYLYFVLELVSDLLLALTQNWSGPSRVE